MKKQQKSAPRRRVITVTERPPIDPDYAPLKATAEKRGISVSTLKRLVELDDTFPRPIRLSSKIILFPQAAVNEWFRAQEANAASSDKKNGLPIPKVRDLRGTLKAKRDAAAPAKRTPRAASAVRSAT